MQMHVMLVIALSTALVGCAGADATNSDSESTGEVRTQPVDASTACGNPQAVVYGQLYIKGNGQPAPPLSSASLDAVLGANTYHATINSSGFYRLYLPVVGRATGTLTYDGVEYALPALSGFTDGTAFIASCESAGYDYSLVPTSAGNSTFYNLVHGT
jgi:hypothetical protein